MVPTSAVITIMNTTPITSNARAAFGDAEKKFRDALAAQQAYEENPVGWFESRLLDVQRKLQAMGVRVLPANVSAPIEFSFEDEIVPRGKLPAQARPLARKYLAIARQYSDAETGYPPKFFSLDLDPEAELMPLSDRQKVVDLLNQGLRGQLPTSDDPTSRADSSQTPARSERISHKVKGSDGEMLCKTHGDPLKRAYRVIRQELEAGKINEAQLRDRKNAAANEFLREVVQRFGDAEKAKSMLWKVGLWEESRLLFNDLETFIRDRVEMAIKAGPGAQNFGVLMDSFAAAYSAKDAAQGFGARKAYSTEAQDAAKRMVASFAGALGYRVPGRQDDARAAAGNGPQPGPERQVLSARGGA